MGSGEVRGIWYVDEHDIANNAVSLEYFIKTFKELSKMADEMKIKDMDLVSNFEMPAEAPRETKYPWRELAEAGTGEDKKTLLIACDNEEDANKTKSNLISSVFSFYSRNELPFQVVARAFEIPDRGWHVGVQIKDRA